MNEKKYPIYEIETEWSEDSNSLPGSTSVCVMFKHHLSEIEKKLLISDFEMGLRKKNNIRSPMKSKVKFSEFEIWSLSWFAHYTFDNGQTNQEILQSFEEYVRRKVPVVHKLKHSLMGAEDRWRWGICRCEKCRQRGVITIVH